MAPSTTKKQITSALDGAVLLHELVTLLVARPGSKRMRDSKKFLLRKKTVIILKQLMWTLF